MEPLRNGELVEEGGAGDVYSGRKVSSSASNRSSLSPVSGSGFNSPDGLGSPEEYCKQVSTCTCTLYVYVKACVESRV